MLALADKGGRWALTNAHITDKNASKGKNISFY